MPRPLCFVLMPFGKKPGSGGAVIDFDAVYGELIKPAIESAGLVPIRADEEQAGGIIHKPMFERLILCEYAVTDLTTANANVFYELGVRHAVKPATTMLLFAADGTRLPFDVAPLRTLPYQLGPDGRPSAAEADRTKLAQMLNAAQADAVDSPVYQLVDGFPDIQHIKTDVFREQVEYSAVVKDELKTARKHGVDAIRAIEQRLGPLDRVEAGVLVDLLLSYRGVSAWDDMIRLAGAMPDPLRRTPMVQEQLAFGLNRAGRGEEAERVLVELVASRGPSSETYGLLGRVYKDRWDTALKQGERTLARGLLDKAIDAYLKGFETDWRDAYPGINAVTLMTLKTPPDPRAERLLPVVRYAVERKIASGKPDYWDYATLLELAVLAKDENGAMDALAQALPVIRESWEPETTLRNLRLIRSSREARNETVPWMKDIEDELERKAKK
ncbi:MAG TPA: TRAFs-binding domain-containing protein [Xanthobacteraceae bacterium]|nr:TRAFs-binding domain-containing protein [Xanthobacteraceae bacterium]